MRQIKIFLLMVLIGVVLTSCISNDEIRAKQAEERDEIFNEGYEAGYEDGSYDEDNYDPEEWEREKQNIFEEILYSMPINELNEYLEYMDLVAYETGHEERVFVYGFQNGYNLAKKNVSNDNIVFYLDYKISKDHLSELDREWGFNSEDENIVEPDTKAAETP